jgi:hypothetical protein
VTILRSELHPYVVFLPSGLKTRILSSIFGSKVSVDILRFSLHQGIAAKIYQKDLVRRLHYSNKTIILNLRTLTKLGVLMENMEKSEAHGRTVWVKIYMLSDSGRWFALLLAQEKDLSETEKSEIVQNLFRAYVKSVKSLSQELHIDRRLLKNVFEEEMK